MISIKDFSKIILLAFLWGPTFLLVKVAVNVYPPITLTFYRCLFSSLFLFSAAIVLKQMSWKSLKKNWADIIFAGLIGNALAFTMCALGEVYVASSTAGIIEGSVPMFTLLLTKIFIPGRKISGMQILGILLGFIGLLIIFIPSLNFFSIPDTDDSELGLGILYLIVMAIAFAGSFTYSELRLSHLPAIETLTVQILSSTVILFFISLGMEGPVMLTVPPKEALLALITMGFTSSLGWIVLYNLLRNVGASLSSIATYLFPIIAILLGIIFLEEAPDSYMYAGAFVVFLSMVLVSVRKKVKESHKSV